MQVHRVGEHVDLPPRVVGSVRLASGGLIEDLDGGRRLGGKAEGGGGGGPRGEEKSFKHKSRFFALLRVFSYKKNKHSM
jgi:hypothetical protein